MEWKYLLNGQSLSQKAARCDGCGRCVEVCPHGVLEIRKKKAIILDRARCMECGACMVNCPRGALSVNAGVGCAAAVIHSMLRGGQPTCDCGGAGKKGTGCC